MFEMPNMYMEIVLCISAGINVVLLIWSFISRRKSKILKREKNESILNFQSYPHTVRNKIDDLSERTNSLKGKMDALYEEINNVSDYLGEMAYGDIGSQEETIIPISEEITMMRNYVKT